MVEIIILIIVVIVIKNPILKYFIILNGSFSKKITTLYTKINGNV